MFLVRILYDAYLKFIRDDGWAIASHIALSILTSLFPFLIFLTALAGFFGLKQEADAATALIFESWPPNVAQPISAEIRNVLTQQHGGLLTIGGVLAIYFASSGVEALRIALNRAYDQPDRRPWWFLRLESILFVFIGAASLLAIAFLMVLAPLARALAEKHLPGLMQQIEPQLAPLYGPVRYGVTSSVVGFAVLAAHVLLPAGRPSLVALAPGLLLTLGASLSFGAAFGAYLARFAGNYVSTYAGLASIMIALVFLYTLAVIFIYGAELNQTIAARASSRRSVASVSR